MSNFIPPANGESQGTDKINFARQVYFDAKITNLHTEADMNHGVHNGVRKITTDPVMFMDPVSVKECLLSLKMKNSEGYSDPSQQRPIGTT